MPYSYSWSTSPVQTTNTASALGASTYTVSISDVNSCTSSATVTLTQPPVLTSAAAITSNYNGQNISCFGASNGTASVTPAGGTTPYSFSWSTVPPQLTANASGLGATTYTATTTDANGCTSTSTVVLTQPAAIATTATVISNYNGQNISCNGASDGSALATVSGGTMPYTYSWSTSPVQTNDTASALGASTYTVSISDANSCTSSATVALTQPAALVAVATTTSLYGEYNVSCFGSVNGSIDLTVSGGTSPYSYPWSNGATTEDLAGIGAGVYSVNVMDLNGCTDSASATILQPSSLVASINSISNYNGYAISCYGSSNGSIDAGITGGMPPYSYSWSNGALTQDQSLLTAGTYVLTVVDFNGCTDLVTATLSQPAKLIVSIDSISNYNGYGVSCYYSSNGNIFTTVSGGVTPYNYAWNNGAVTEDITGLSANGYILNVEDFNGCVANADTTLIQPAPFNSNYTFVDPGCNGMSNGSIDFTLMGGVMPYNYFWSNGSITQDLINIPSGTYNVIYADINGCIDSTSIILSEPLVLNNNISQQNVLCYAGSNGSIDINIAGGTLPYSYLWSTGSTQEDIDSLTIGTYYVTITDAQGCTRIDTLDVTQPDSLFLTIESPVLANGHNISFFQGADGSINLTVNGGVLPYTYTWATGQNTEDLEYLPAGQYSVVVTDEHGCAISGSITLTEPFDLAMPTGITPNNDGSNDFFVVKGIEAYTDNVLTIYNRWGNIVYKKENYFNEWYGTNSSGEELPEATYFAILEINGRAIVLNGYVEIRRK
jgi:gliding motility-associated-like protein